MQLEDILTPERTASHVKAGSKKRVLEIIGDLVMHDTTKLNATEVFESLIARERLGSTGIGYGVAIPHGRVKNNDQVIGALVHLDEPIEFDAVDDQPVDLLFALLVPEHAVEEHLQVLAALAEMFSDAELREELRSAQDNATLYDLARSHYQGTEPHGPDSHRPQSA